jgi:hypothetical protein
MEYQSPSDRFLVAQQPTSDWRDEQWVTGYGLFVNTIVYSYLRLLGCNERAESVHREMSRFTITGGKIHHHVHEGLVVKHKPYYAFWSYKVHSSERFDLLGNSLAILSGIASPTRANEMVTWIEEECAAMQHRGERAALEGQLVVPLIDFAQFLILQLFFGHGHTLSPQQSRMQHPGRRMLSHRGVISIYSDRI